MTIRDLKQLQETPPWAFTTLEGFTNAETLLRDSLHFVPYVEEHRNVWSPQFARIILEAASQVDSVWKATTVIDDSSKSSEKLTLKKHFERFGSLVANQETVFCGTSSPCTIRPFESWRSSFAEPSWWTAYNALKHDRLGKQAMGTSEMAISAVGALLLALIYCGKCDLAFTCARFLDTSRGSYNPWAQANLIREVPFKCRTIVETQLFAHPLGIFGVPDCNLSAYWDSRSERFNVWWVMNHKKYVNY